MYQWHEYEQPCVYIERHEKAMVTTTRVEPVLVVLRGSDYFLHDTLI
jgi:hypothetical protein